MLIRQEIVKATILVTLVVADMAATYYIFGLPHGEMFARWIIIPFLLLITVTELAWKYCVPSLSGRYASRMQQLASGPVNGSASADVQSYYNKLHALILGLVVVLTAVWGLAVYCLANGQPTVGILLLAVVLMLSVVRFVLLTMLPKSEQ